MYNGSLLILNLYTPGRIRVIREQTRGPCTMILRYEVLRLQYGGVVALAQDLAVGLSTVPAPL